jgi:hypothetical protein
MNEHKSAESQFGQPGVGGKLTSNELLTLWYLRAVRALQNHRNAVDQLRLNDSRLTKVNAVAGILVLALSGISITLQDSGIILGAAIRAEYVSVALTLASATVLATSIWQLLVQYGMLSVRVEWIAADYSALVREIEAALTKEVSDEQLVKFREAIDHLSHRGQFIVPKMWNSNLAPLNVGDLVSKLQKRIAGAT